jgi:hypothetical protein
MAAALLGALGIGIPVGIGISVGIGIVVGGSPSTNVE